MTFLIYSINFKFLEMSKSGITSFLLFCCMINSFGLNGQNINFQIDGIVNVDSGKISLHLNPDYVAGETCKITAKIENKNFSIAGYIQESQGAFITIDDVYMSSDFVIDKGLQTVSINIESPQEMPIITNETMHEEYPKYTDFYKVLNTERKLFEHKRDSLYLHFNGDLPDSIKLILNENQKAIYMMSDSTLLKYVERNPNSKIAFWELIRLMNWGYEPIFDSIFNAFSDTLRNGCAGKILKTKLQDCKQLSIGQMFPNFNCINTNNEIFSSQLFIKNKFTLIEFWYSKCSPCRRQFNSLKDLYQQYSGSGFEIVAISVDRVKDKKEMENLILSEKLVWKQYWDKDGAESQKYSIHAFPTNFLIDSSGKIIEKNISMEALYEFLKSAL